MYWFGKAFGADGYVVVMKDPARVTLVVLLR